MVSNKRLALVLVMTVILTEKSPTILFANAEVSLPKQCTQYTNVTENLQNRNGVIFMGTQIISTSLCAHKQPKNRWYRFRHHLCSPENTSCLRYGVPELADHPCHVHETVTSTLCFEVSRKVRIGRSVNITNCGSFYVYQLLQLTCKDNTTNFRRRKKNGPQDSSCNVRPTGKLLVYYTRKSKTHDLRVH